MIIVVDFDGTCVTHDYPRVGTFIGAEEVLRELVECGHELILWTMRSDSKLQEAVNWFKVNNIPLFGINTNPEQGSWTNSPKAYGQLYILTMLLWELHLPTMFTNVRMLIGWLLGNC